MASRQMLQKAAAGTLQTVLPNAGYAFALHGNVGYTVKVTVKDEDNENISPAVVDAAATVDALSDTVASYSAATPCNIVLSSGAVAPTRGNLYVLQRIAASNQTTLMETAESMAYVAGTKIMTISDRPSQTPVAGDRVYGVTITKSLTAAQTATLGTHYRAIWSLYDNTGALVHSWEDVFAVVLAVPSIRASTPRLRAYAPDLTSQWEQLVTGNDAHGWDRRIYGATDRVLEDLESYGDWAGAIVDWTQAERVVYERVLMEMAPTYIPSGGNWTGPEWMARRQQEYRAAFEAWRSSIRWYDADENREIADTERDAIRTQRIVF